MNLDGSEYNSVRHIVSYAFIFYKCTNFIMTSHLYCFYFIAGSYFVFQRITFVQFLIF